MCDATPLHGDHGELIINGQDTSLVALVGQLHQNWDRGDNAANDDLIVQIREHIRRHRAATQCCSPVAFHGRTGGMVVPGVDRETSLSPTVSR